MNTSASMHTSTLEFDPYVAVQTDRSASTRAQSWAQIWTTAADVRRHTASTSLTSRPRTSASTVHLSVTEAGDEGTPSDLGLSLRRLRAEIVASGEHLLSWDELEQELAELRGEK